MAKNRISRFDPLVTAASVTAGSGDLRSTSSLHSTTELGSHDRPAVSFNYGKLINWLYGKGVQADSELLQILGSMGIGMQDMSGAQQADWNKQLLDQMLAQLSEEDARKYNQDVLAEQRLYDSPTNQLARLMAAGISRDKAIEMLSGSGGSGGSVAAGSPAAQAAGIPASQSDLNRVQAQTAIANTVFGGISTVASLVSLGFSIPQAIMQAKITGSQASLSQKALLGLQSADAVMSCFSNALSMGALSPEDIEGFSNADDALKYAYDHQDTAAFSPIFKDGSFANVFGTQFGRENFSKMWHNVRDTRDYGSQLDQFIRGNELRNSLQDLDNQKARRDFFFDFYHQLNSLILEDEQIANEWNNFRHGQYQILIDGEIYQQQQYNTKRAQRIDYSEGVMHDAFKSFVENGQPRNNLGEPIEPDEYSSGRDIINYITFGEWYNRLANNLVTTSNQPYEKLGTGYGRGGKPFTFGTGVMTSNRKEYANFLRTHQDLVYTGAFVNKMVQEGRLNSLQGDHRAFWQFCDMWNYSGAGDMVKTVTDAVPSVALPIP